jgi:hypothetical protein
MPLAARDASRAARGHNSLSQSVQVSAEFGLYDEPMLWRGEGGNEAKLVIVD